MKPVKQQLVNATPEERIAMYMMDESNSIVLSKSEQELMVMINFCDDQMRRLNLQKDVAILLTKKYKIGLTKAYHVIAKTQVVYGTTMRQQKSYWRAILADAILADMQRARARGDSKSLVGFYDKLIKVQALDKDEERELPPAPPPATIVFQFNPALLGVDIKGNLEERVKKFISGDIIDAEIIEQDGE